MAEILSEPLSSQGNIFTSTLKRDLISTNNNVYDLLITPDPPQPISNKRESFKNHTFQQRGLKTFEYRKRSRFKVKTVKAVKQSLEKWYQDEVKDELVKQKLFCIDKIRNGQVSNRLINEKFKEILNSRNPILPSTLRIISTANIFGYKCSHQCVMLDGREIRINGSIGGAERYVTVFSENFPTLQETSPHNIGISKSVFKPGPLSKKRQLRESYQKDDSAKPNIVTLPPVMLRVKPQIGIKIEKIVCRKLEQVMCVDDKITEAFADFAVSTIQTKKSGFQKSHEKVFALKYCNDQKVLMMKSMLNTEWENPINKKENTFVSKNIKCHDSGSLLHKKDSSDNSIRLMRKRSLPQTNYFPKKELKLDLISNNTIPCSVVIPKLDLKNVLPYCMVHMLYYCFCKGVFIQRYLTERSDSPIGNIQDSVILKTHCDKYENQWVKCYTHVLEEAVDRPEVDECARTCRYSGRSHNSEYYTSTHKKIENLERNDIKLRSKLMSRFSCSPARKKPIDLVDVNLCESDNSVSSRSYNSDQESLDGDDQKLPEATCTETLQQNTGGKILSNCETLQQNTDCTIASNCETQGNAEKSTVANILRDLPTNKCEKSEKSVHKLLTSESKAISPKSMPATSKIFNRKNVFKEWLENQYKLLQGGGRITFGPPILNAIQLFPWNILVDRYKNRKNIFLCTVNEPMKIVIACTPTVKVLKTIDVNILNNVVVEKNKILSNLRNGVKDDTLYVILRARIDCWEIIGTVIKSDSSNGQQVEDVSRIRSAETKTLLSNSSEEVQEKSLENLPDHKTNPADSPIKDTNINVTEKSGEVSKQRWFLLMVENDFTELQFLNRGFFVKRENIVRAMNATKITGKKVKLSCPDLESDNDFGVYTMPHAKKNYVVIGPYKPNEPLGIETIKSSAMTNSPLTRGMWVHANLSDIISDVKSSEEANVIERQAKGDIACSDSIGEFFQCEGTPFQNMLCKEKEITMPKENDDSDVIASRTKIDVACSSSFAEMLKCKNPTIKYKLNNKGGEMTIHKIKDENVVTSCEVNKSQTINDIACSDSERIPFNPIPEVDTIIRQANAGSNQKEGLAKPEVPKPESWLNESNTEFCVSHSQALLGKKSRLKESLKQNDSILKVKDLRSQAFGYLESNISFIGHLKAVKSLISGDIKFKFPGFVPSAYYKLADAAEKINSLLTLLVKRRINVRWRWTISKPLSPPLDIPTIKKRMCRLVIGRANTANATYVAISSDNAEGAKTASGPMVSASNYQWFGNIKIKDARKQKTATAPEITNPQDFSDIIITDVRSLKDDESETISSKTSVVCQPEDTPADDSKESPERNPEDVIPLCVGNKGDKT